MGSRKPAARDDALFTTGWMEIREIVCAGAGDDGREEQVPQHTMVLPRSGIFVRRDSRAEAVGDPNVAMLFPRNQPYDIRHPTGAPDLSTTVAMTDEAIRELVDAEVDGSLDEVGFSRGFRTMDRGDHLLHHFLLRRIRDGADSLEVEEIAVHLLRRLLGSADTTPPVREKNPETSETHRAILRRAQVVLAERYAGNLTLSALAREAFASPFHLCRIFKRRTGMTIHRYRERLRLLEAIRRIEAGEGSLSMIALDLGFSHHSHMTRAFGASFGQPPSAFRRGLLSPDTRPA